MDCPEVTERLPWLLNDTLPMTERAEVLSHLEGCESCREQLRETAGVLEALEQHPATEQLVEYVFGTEMEGPERAAIIRHIAECRRCREEVDLLARSHRQMPSKPFFTARVLAVAATLVVTVSVGLLARLWQEAHQRETVLEAKVRTLEEQIGRLGRPSASGQVIDLLPLRARERAGTVRQPQATVPGAIETTFLLNSRLPRDAGGCSIRLLSEGKEVWSAQQATRGVNGEFLVRVPSGFLQAGPYRLSVACGASTEEFEFRIQ